MISVKILSCFLLKSDKLIIKFTWQNKQAKAAEEMLKEGSMKKLTLPNSKINYKAS